MAHLARMSSFFRTGSLLVPVGKFRRCVAYCSSDSSETASSREHHPELTPHQRMAQELIKKREKRKNSSLQQKPTTNNVRHSLLAIHAASDLQVKMQILADMQKNFDFAVLDPQTLIDIIRAVSEHNLEFGPITQLICSVVERRVREKIQVLQYLQVLAIISSMERVPHSTLVLLDEVCCHPNQMPYTGLGVIAKVFSKSKDYPRCEKVLQQVALRMNEEDIIHYSLIQMVLMSFQHCSSLHLIPRSFVSKLERCLEDNFMECLIRRPAFVRCSLRLFQVHGVVLSEECLKTFTAAINAMCESRTGIPPYTLEIICDLGSHFDRETAATVLSSIGELNCQHSSYVMKVVELIMTFGLSVPPQLLETLRAYLSKNFSEITRRPHSRNVTLGFLAAHDITSTSATVVGDVLKNLITDMHQMPLSSAINMLGSVMKMSEVNVLSLERPLIHLAVLLNNDANNLDAEILSKLCFLYGESRLKVPRVLPTVQISVGELCSHSITKLGHVAKEVLSMFSRCGFLDEAAAKETILRLEDAITGELLTGISPVDLVMLATFFMYAERFPDSICKAIIPVLTSVPILDTLLKARPSYVVALASWIDMVKLAGPDLDLPSPRSPGMIKVQEVDLQFKTHLYTSRYRIHQSCAALAAQLFDSPAFVLGCVWTDNCQTVAAALLANKNGELVPWSETDFVSSNQPSPPNKYLDNSTPLVVDAQRAGEQGFTPIGILSFSEVFTISNNVGLFSGKAWADVRQLEYAGWKVVLTCQSWPPEQIKTVISEGVKRFCVAK